MRIPASALRRRICRGFSKKATRGCNGRADKRSTGIGLYLCRQIMEKLSHTIRIESEMGAGTKVYLGLDTVSL